MKLIKKIIKILSKTIGITLISILGLLIVLFIVVQFPTVQNQIAKIAVNYISKQKNVDFSIKNFRFYHFNTIEIDSIHLSDLERKPFIDVEKVKIIIKKITLNNMSFYFKEINVDNVSFTYTIYYGHKRSNLMELLKSAKSKSTSKKKVRIYCDNAYAYNWNYIYHNYNKCDTMLNINFHDLDVSNANAHASNINIINDSIYMKVNEGRLNEKYGFFGEVTNADLYICKHSIKILNVYGHTKTSNINLDLIFRSNNYLSYKYFFDSIYIDGTLKPNSIVDLKDIAMFSSHLAGCDNIVNVSGNVKGTVNNLSINNIDLLYGSNTRFNGDIHIENTMKKDIILAINIADFHTNANDLESINIPALKYNVYAPYNIHVPEQVHTLGNMALNGHFNGKTDNFTTDFNLITDEGNIITTISYTPISKKINKFDIQLAGSSVNVGKIFNVYPDIQTIDANLHLEGTAENFSPKYYLIEGKVNRINLEHQTLHDLAIKVNSDSNELNANVSLFNENIFLQGFISHFFNTPVPITNISINAEQTNLSKLGLFPLANNIITSFFINSNIEGSNIDNLNMQTYVSNFSVSNNKGTIKTQDFSVSQQYDNNNNIKTLSLSSEPVNLEMKGNFSYKDLPGIVKNIANSIISHNNKNIASKNKTCNFDMNIDINDIGAISYLFIPDLQINGNIKINMNMSDPNHFTLKLLSNDIDYGKFTLGNVDIISEYHNDTVNANISMSNSYLNDSKLIKLINISDSKWYLTLIQDTATASITWNDTVNNRNGKIHLISDISELPTIKLTIPDSIYLYANKQLYKATSNDYLIYNDNTISVDNLIIEGNNATLQVDGTYSKALNDSITATFRNVNLSMFKTLIPETFDIKGIINGNCSLSQNKGYPLIFANLGINDINVNDTDFGNFYLNSSWDNFSKTVNLSSYLLQNIDNDTIITISGIYSPFINNEINGNININNFDFASLDPFLNSYISHPYGMISGNIGISNTLKRPITNGKISFKDAGLTVKYTNTSYTFSNEISIRPESIILNKFRLYDSNKNYFDVSGNINHDNWKNFILDIQTNFKEFTVMNNKKKVDEMIYGNTILSGTAGAKGKIDNIDITADLNTNPGTNITIALSSNKTATQMSFVNFVNNDSLSTNTYTQKKTNNYYSINAKANIDNSSQLNIILPYNMGSMHVSGTGDITYTQEKNGNNNMIGDYTVNTGNFELNFQNLLKRDFTIKDGGTIIFNGDPKYASLDLQAVYQVRASLDGIPTITDQSIAETRIPINCIINFTGALYDPIITFNIELPNVVDNDIKTMILSAIDVNDQATLSKQVFSLLLLKSFSFSSDNTTINAGIGTNSLSIISSQLAQWVSLINKDFDMGVNYNPGNELTPEEFEVYMKTQFFNDRLIIDGNFGMQSKSTVNTDKTSNNIIGDVQVEYKVSSDGKLRVKAFNRTNQYSIFENNNPYTQGIGLSYYTEFDKPSELLKKKRRGSY